MIKVEMTVREAILVASKFDDYGGDEGRSIRDRVIEAIEVAMGVNQNTNVTITGGMDTNNRIHCIRVIRNATGLGLKDAKEWTDVIVGHYGSYAQWVEGGNCNTIKLNDPQKAEELLKDLRQLGCEGFLS